MRTSIIVRLGLAGIFAYFIYIMFANDSSTVMEYHETERDLVSQVRQNRNDENELIAELYSNLDNLNITDPNLHKCLKNNLGYVVHKYVLEKNSDPTLFTSLDCSSMSISSLEGIQHFDKLESLKLGRNKISDLGPLSGLSNLKSLDLSNTEVTTLWRIASLQIETLNVSNAKLNRVDELLTFPALKNLQYRIDNERDCVNLDIFFSNPKVKAWNLARPSSCLDQYGEKVPFRPSQF